MKIGILGGTFNPIHLGHLILAEQVRQKLDLDKVIFVPSFLPPHKDSSVILDARARFAMVKLAINKNKFFEISDIEIKRKEKSYTIVTLKELQSQYPGSELFFIIGSDIIKELAQWQDIKEVERMAKFVIATRPGYPLEGIPEDILPVQIQALDISAYEIRERIKQNISIRYLVPESVRKYIIKRRLYA